jgi:hypothetical protein
MRRPTSAFVALALALAGGPSTPVWAAPSEIEITAEERPWAERAAAASREGDWNAVADILQEGYEATGSLRLLAGWAKAEKEAGDCDKALAIYDRFFAADPTPAQIDSVTPHVEACRVELAVADPGPAPEPTAPDPVAEAAPEPAPKRWPRDVTGGVLVGVGGALLATGVGLAVAGELDDARVDGEATHGAFEDRLRRAQGLVYASYAMFAVGGALAIGGIARWVVVARRSQRTDETVGLAPIRGGAVVSVSGRFGRRFGRRFGGW